MTDHNTADRLRTLAEGPALDLPPVRWEAPVAVPHRLVARWGDLPWETDATWVPSVYLCAYPSHGDDGPFIEFDEQRFTPDEARVVLNRLASAIAMAEEVSR